MCSDLFVKIRFFRWFRFVYSDASVHTSSANANSQPNSDSHKYTKFGWYSCVACSDFQEEQTPGAWRLELQAAGKWLRGDDQIQSGMHAQIVLAKEREQHRISAIEIDEARLAQH